MKNPVQIPVIFDGLRTLSDGSIKMTFATREVKAEEAVTLLQYRNSEGWLLFKPAQFVDADLIDVPVGVPEFATNKTASQRLRNVLYRLWEYRGEGGSFETWRIEQMEKIISSYKGLLPKEPR